MYLVCTGPAKVPDPADQISGRWRLVKGGYWNFFRPLSNFLVLYNLVLSFLNLQFFNSLILFFFLEGRALPIKSALMFPRLRAGRGGGRREWGRGGKEQVLLVQSPQTQWQGRKFSTEEFHSPSFCPCACHYLPPSQTHRSRRLQCDRCSCQSYLLIWDIQITILTWDPEAMSWHLFPCAFLCLSFHKKGKHRAVIISPGDPELGSQPAWLPAVWSLSEVNASSQGTIPQGCITEAKLETLSKAGDTSNKVQSLSCRCRKP